MRFLRGFLVPLVLAPIYVAAIPKKRHYDTHNYYVLEHIPHSQGASVGELLDTFGVELVEQAGELEDTWLVRTPKTNLDLEPREEEDPVLATFAEIQARAGGAYLEARSEEHLFARRVASSVRFLELQTPYELIKRAPPPELPPTPTSSRVVASRFDIQDPLFGEQWHLVNEDHPEHILNVTGLWEMGLHGRGILTSFLDDGLDFDAEDLKDAFDAKNSYDFNAHVPLPRPTGALDHHGTRCAGQVTARRNGACGVGIAWEAKAAGVRILGGPIRSVDEAAALNYGYQDVHLYSCSWGPRDNGQTMEGPGYLIRKAVVNGILKGRGGKGSIFVFASGNGGRKGDQCNFDGYTNSIYSVTVGSLDYTGEHPLYSEPCSAVMVSSYSSGAGKYIVTTDRGKNECSRKHGGTSAAAPNVVGVMALALQVRPDLTWRDVQHLCVQTAQHINPEDPDWDKTAAGRYYSNKYGYGVLDGYAFVTAARDWQLVKPHAWYQSPTRIFNNGTIKRIKRKVHIYKGGVPLPKGGFKDIISVTKEQLAEHNFEALEHIDVRVWVNHTRRGDLEASIISPNGIKSVLSVAREDDESIDGYPGWRFNSIKHWGENPIGNWTIHINDQEDGRNHGLVLGWNLMLWGSAVDPAKAKVWVEPVEDWALPPNFDPDRPVINDPALTMTTHIGKPTGLPEDDDDSEDSDDSWLDKVAGLISGKTLLTAVGFAFIAGMIALFLIWRRRKAQIAQYHTLDADEEIRLDNMEEDHHRSQDGPSQESRTTRQLYDSFGEASTDQLPGPPPPMRSALEPPNPRTVGFHSGFLEDDEPSAGLTPKYRDDSDDDEDDDDDDDDRRPQHPSDIDIPNTGDIRHSAPSPR